MTIDENKLDYIKNGADDAIEEFRGGRRFTIEEVIAHILADFDDEDRASVGAMMFDEEGRGALLTYLRGRTDIRPQNIGPTVIWSA
ncbi:hypothetical protein [Shinella sp.]|uniref:hypothetical protein n=1 Tax=Shinella sp. TaxID=1870904 RepID=UPI003D2E7787